MSTLAFSGAKGLRTTPMSTRTNTFTDKPGALNSQVADIYAHLRHLTEIVAEKRLPPLPPTNKTATATSSESSSTSATSTSEDDTPNVVVVRASTAKESSIKGQTPCHCQQVISVATPGHCGECGEPLQAMLALRTELVTLQDEVETKENVVLDLTRQNRIQKSDLDQLAQRVHHLENELDQSRQEVASLRLDVRMLNDKYVDEIEKVAEIQHSKQLVEDELEDLSRQLFEKANGMVECEARQRYEMEQQLESTRVELAKVQQALADERKRNQIIHTENQRLLGLVPRAPTPMNDTSEPTPSDVTNEDVSKGVAESDHNASTSPTNQREHTVADNTVSPFDSTSADSSPRYSASSERPPSPKLDIMTDEQQFLEFQDFVFHCPSAKLFKIHSFNFMRNCAAEDVEPCLRFGPTPRMSSKNLLDAILFDTIIVEPIASDDRPTVAVAPPPESTMAAATRFLSSKQALLWERFSGSVTANPHGCQACGRQGECSYRFKMGYYEEDEDWCYIDQFCRDRLTAVGEFYLFIRNIYHGFYSSRTMQDLYMESQRLRLRMLYARMGTFSLFQTHPKFLVERLNAPSMSSRRQDSHPGSASPAAMALPTPPVSTSHISESNRSTSPTSSAASSLMVTTTTPALSPGHPEMSRVLSAVSSTVGQLSPSPERLRTLSSNAAVAQTKSGLWAEAEKLRARSLSLPKLGSFLKGTLSTEESGKVADSPPQLPCTTTVSSPQIVIAPVSGTT
ncbi:hypothetical protein IWQ62_004529 [Dispira parvispora]|uniref:GDP/GTP exchange factor Sec2 N-terminal domain-containing protein n=1 Tax=Dispira parvispora TaxID=1520584 RepID=A0A9W8AM88_9FUNG|nr:hypothetical protein IWQ62_004529 [Dispira parvispora]